ncbi:MAG: flavodoxin domain-containing protein [Gemmatimonadales bacterium]
MPKILVLYGTTNGHTARIARTVAETLERSGARVETIDAARGNPPHPALFDGVVVAASIHVGGYQRSVRRWLRRHAAVLNGMPTLFLSVCLAVLERKPEVDRELERIVDKLVAKTGWRPDAWKPIAGALPYTKYGWLTRLVMRRIAEKQHGDTDTTRDFEYTDWSDLRETARAFAARVGDQGMENPPEVTPLAGTTAPSSL